MAALFLRTELSVPMRGGARVKLHQIAREGNLVAVSALGAERVAAIIDLRSKDVPFAVVGDVSFAALRPSHAVVLRGESGLIFVHKSGSAVSIDAIPGRVKSVITRAGGRKYLVSATVEEDGHLFIVNAVVKREGRRLEVVRRAVHGIGREGVALPALNVENGKRYHAVVAADERGAEFFALSWKGEAVFAARSEEPIDVGDVLAASFDTRRAAILHTRRNIADGLVAVSALGAERAWTAPVPPLLVPAVVSERLELVWLEGNAIKWANPLEEKIYEAKLAGTWHPLSPPSPDPNRPGVASLLLKSEDGAFVMLALERVGSSIATRIEKELKGEAAVGAPECFCVQREASAECACGTTFSIEGRVEDVKRAPFGSLAAVKANGKWLLVSGEASEEVEADDVLPIADGAVLLARRGLEFVFVEQ